MPNDHIAYLPRRVFGTLCSTWRCLAKATVYVHCILSHDEVKGYHGNGHHGDGCHGDGDKWVVVMFIGVQSVCVCTCIKVFYPLNIGFFVNGVPTSCRHRYL